LTWLPLPQTDTLDIKRDKLICTERVADKKKNIWQERRLKQQNCFFFNTNSVKTSSKFFRVSQNLPKRKFGSIPFYQRLS